MNYSNANSPIIIYPKMLLRLLVVLTLSITISSKMVYLSELFRHGARYPVSDIYDGKDTKPFHGTLTGVGMRQQYLLGSYLRNDYLAALGLRASFDPIQVEVFADSSQRCVQSVYAHMAGWFPLGKGEQIPAGLDPSFLKPPFEQLPSLSQQESIEQPAITGGYQPIPIKIGRDFFPSCPQQAVLIAKRGQVIAPKVLLLQAQETVFINRMRSMFNVSLQFDNLAGMVQLYDTIVCDQNLGRALPADFTNRQFLELKYIQNYLFILLYAENLARIYSTPIAKSVIDKMDMVIAGNYQDKKLTVYSGHDTNVAPMLSFLNLSNADCVQKKYRNQTVTGNCADPVPFASSIQWELHLRDSTNGVELDPRQAGNYYVRVKYNGEYYKLCETYFTECDYPQFSKRIRASLMDFNKECGVK